MFQKLVFLIPMWVMLGLQGTIFATSDTIPGTSGLNHDLVRHSHHVNSTTPNGINGSVYNSSITTQCKMPPVTTTIMVSKPIVVAAGQVFDCNYARYQPVDTSCDLDLEKTIDSATFILEDRATLRHCHIGFSQESVYCLGNCDIIDSHWRQVGDEAITFFQMNGSSVVKGCSFSNAGNKALQSDRGGTIHVKNTCFYNVDIAYRSSGGGVPMKRDVVFDNIEIHEVNVLAGFNHFQGDTVEIKCYKGERAGLMCEDKKQGNGTTPAGCTIRESCK